MGTLTGPNDAIWTQEVSPDLDLATIKMLSAVDLGLNFESMLILRNGAPPLDDSKTLGAIGISDGEILMALPNVFGGNERNQRLPTAPINWTEKAQEMLQKFNRLSDSDRRIALSNYNGWTAMQTALRENDTQKLGELMKADYDKKKEEQDRLRRAEENPMDPENQKYLEERIRQQHVDRTYMEAMENSPEMFGTVIMLYINCKVNGKPVKAFVDSGAQMTIMSQACAERCGIVRLIDQRWQGMAVGVGKQKIIGRVHMGQMEIEGVFLPT